MSLVLNINVAFGGISPTPSEPYAKSDGMINLRLSPSKREEIETNLDFSYVLDHCA